jgi:hypothetical protein
MLTLLLESEEAQLSAEPAVVAALDEAAQSGFAQVAPIAVDSGPIARAKRDAVPVFVIKAFFG